MDWRDEIRNEEELRSLILIPLLGRLGIEHDRLQVERSFSFKAGRQVLTEELPSQLQELRPRLDVLVTRDGRNLFVVELKRPETELTENDALQAISYARLVHPIAPYALVTNGGVSRIYDVVSRQPVEPAALRLEDGYEIVLPEADDFRALDCFLRLSPANLRRFCGAQVEAAIRPLKGSLDDLNRRYVSELHVSRASAANAMHRFREAPEPVLALIGASGIGKTSTMCHLALSAQRQGDIVLFLRGSELGESFLGYVATEFAWTFREQAGPEALVRRLSELAREQRLLLYLDGVDEWRTQNPARQLGSLARHLRSTRVKLVVSCKTGDWASLLGHRGTPTDFGQLMSESGDLSQVVIGPLCEEEFWSAIRKYEKAYGFHGVWDPALLDEAKRSPFFMRVAFEVAAADNLAELRESTYSIFERYHDTCLQTTPVPDVSERILLAAAKLLEQRNASQAPLDDLHSALTLRPTEQVPPDLFNAGILERHGSSYSFGFEGLRNFVLAAKHHNWQAMSTEQFRADVASVRRDGVSGDALIAYYKWARDEHKRILDDRCFAAAETLIASYRATIERHFPALKREFPPGDLDRMGMVLEADLETGWPYTVGLRIRRSDDPEVLIIPATGPRWDSDTMLRHGAGGLSYFLGVNWLDPSDQKHSLLRANLGKLIRDLVHQGRLNESVAPAMAHELLAAVVTSKPELFGEPDRPKSRELLPMTCGKIRYWLRLQQHWHREESEIHERRVEDGTIPVHREGGVISYSVPPLSATDRQEVLKRAGAKASLGVAPSGPRVTPLDDIADRMLRAIDVLGGDYLVESPLFPEAARYRPYPSATVTEEETRYHRRFAEAFLKAYEALVASNFPTLQRHFALFSKLPCYLRVAIVPSVASKQPPSRSLLWEFLEPVGFSLPTSIVSIVDGAELRRENWRDPVSIDGRVYQFFLGTSGGADDLAGHYRHYPDLRLRPQLTVLRDFTYDWLERELKEPLAALENLLGLPDIS